MSDILWGLNIHFCNDIWCSWIRASKYNSYRKIQQDATVDQNFIILYLFEAQHVSGDTPPIIRSQTAQAASGSA